MTLNHRVMRRKTDEGDWLTIHEVYYDHAQGESTVRLSWTEDAIAPSGFSLEELRTELERMLACLDKPVLDWNTDEIIEGESDDDQAASQ